MNLRSLAFGTIWSIGLLASLSPLRAEGDEYLKLTADEPKGGFSDEKPAYMWFKDLSITKTSKLSYDVEMTLFGEVPSNMEDKLYYYLGFDIDNNKSTGGASVTAPNFGNDISIWIVKDAKTNRFEGKSGELKYRGVVQDITLSTVKVAGDKVTFKMRSPLFGMSDTFKFFGSATITRYDAKGEVINERKFPPFPEKAWQLFRPKALERNSRAVIF